MLKTLSVRKFNSKLPIFVQLHGTDEKSHVEKIGVRQTYSTLELKLVTIFFPIISRQFFLKKHLLKIFSSILFIEFLCISIFF